MTLKKSNFSAVRNGIKQSGLSLIEVLIALLVLSIGLVGLGALLLTTLSNVHSASHFSMASSLALDLEERLWYEIAHRSASGDPDLENGCLSQSQIESVITDVETEWTMTEKADDDSWGWTSARRYVLPGLDLDFENEAPIVSANPGISWKAIPISIRWNEARFQDVAGNNQEVFESTITLACRPTF